MAPATIPDTLFKTFSDGVFDESTKWDDSASTTNCMHGVWESVQQGSGGNPNEYHYDKVFMPSTPKVYDCAAAVIMVFTDDFWTPTTSPTAFSSLKYYCDLKMISAGSDQQQRVLVKQDGKYYIGPATGLTLIIGVWVSGSIGNVVASDFDELDPDDLSEDDSSHPNFTTGEDMYFGYVLKGVHVGALTSDGTNGMDNWKVELYRS